MSSELLRRAAAKLRDSHRYDGIKVDSDSKETLLLLRDLLAAREPLAAWLESVAAEGRASRRTGPMAVAQAILGEAS
jgi:hypothetical protein